MIFVKWDWIRIKGNGNGRDHTFLLFFCIDVVAVVLSVSSIFLSFVMGVPPNIIIFTLVQCEEVHGAGDTDVLEPSAVIFSGLWLSNIQTGSRVTF